ncbi:uncharacterized protein LOC106638701 isoform X2 [Copidosoma floridanum]|uniref:uncharacterized protein LOC106638701 isoform X2 n=1 Tax=Copidosoma floridanum TaxID=29053 RepID=UPI0006C949D8|nr:uncharacterized protein LOC106638701 isoform X2 [Copidosoma floridanum]
MTRKRKLADLGKRCRFCLAPDASMIALYDSKQQIGELLTDLQKCTGIQISSKANYPKNVCHVCLYKLEMWSDFKFQFLKINKTLTNYFKLFEQNDDVNDEDCLLLSDDNNWKRVKTCEQPLNKLSEKLQKTPIVPLTDIKPIIDKTSEEKIIRRSSRKTVEQVSLVEKDDQAHHEDINNASPSQCSLSDSLSRGSRRLGRTRKLEREASTKRWVERKNALIVATGKQLYESESDSDSQMSPVQKARIDKNLKKRMERELKCLETNLSEKYCVKQEDVAGGERKMRPRRAKANVEESSTITLNTSTNNASTNNTSPPKTKKSNTTKEKPKLDVKEKSEQVVKVETKDSSMKKEQPTKHVISIQQEMETDEPKTEVKQTMTKSTVEKENIGIVENQRVNDNDREMGVSMIEDIDAIEMEDDEDYRLKENIENEEASKANVPESDGESKLNREADQEMLKLLNDNVNILDKKNNSFSPQLITSEITIGNATYLVTTTLDMPNPTSLNNDISQTTNGISMDSTSQDGQKIDIMNAVQLQKVDGEKESDRSRVKHNGVDVQKCLKIEIEGMEVEALQRVQLDLAHFINDDIRKRLIEEAEGQRKTAPKPTKFKDSYENLNFQLRDIIENVLRNTYTADKLNAANRKVPTLLIQAAEASPMFQPKVKVTQLDFDKARKNLDTGKLNEYEKTKDARRLVGPLSRTIGKRQPILPKRYEDFSINLRPLDDEGAEKKPAGRLTPNKPLAVAPVKINHTGSLELVNAEKSSTRPTQVNYPFKPKDPAICEDLNEDLRFIETPAKKNLAEWSLNGKAVSTPAVNKLTPIATSTPALLTTLEKTVSNVPAKPVTPALSVPTTPVNQVGKLSVPKTSIVAPEKPAMAISVTKSITANIPVKKPSDDAKMLPTPKRERHLCGMCGKELFSMQEANIHMEQHRAEINSKDKPSRPTLSVSTNNGNASISTPTSNVSTGSNNTSINSVQKPKPKLMRCKRCQAIVEAKHVKTHVCNSVKYNCDMCECTFGAQHLLIEHKQTHIQSKNKPKAMVIVPTTPTNTTLSTSITSIKTINKPNQVKSNLVKDKTRTQSGSVAGNYEQKKSEREEEKKSDPKVDKLEQTVLDSEIQGEDDMEDGETHGVACFVCDRVFSNEQQMKDHLQMHCEEVSESIEKDSFTCAFCADKFPNEEQLEEHVNVHLNEDGDEKISMMIDAQLEARRDRQRKPFECDQCGEEFLSKSLLEMHAAVHEEEEEEEAAAEEETQADDELDNLENPEELEGDHVCDVCDEIFDTQAELRTHRDTHNGNTHICILCEMPFVSIEELQEHVSTHL